MKKLALALVVVVLLISSCSLFDPAYVGKWTFTSGSTTFVYDLKVDTYTVIMNNVEVDHGTLTQVDKDTLEFTSAVDGGKMSLDWSVSNNVLTITDGVNSAAMTAM